MQSRSAALYERAQSFLPGGVSRNTVLREPHPLYAERGEGCRVTDLEGVTRIDCANNMASLIHGHCHPEIVAAVTAQLQKGTAFTLATEVEVDYAEHLCGRNAGFEKLRFVNSGTEAVMAGMKAARAFTGRPMIAKVEGAYHGVYDYAEVSQNVTPSTWGDVDRPARVPVVHGTPKNALADVVVFPFNDVARTRAILDEHKDEIACVIVDPMPHRVGMRPADADFMTFLREWTAANGALFLVDEVITFRCSYGGAQEWYGITPDLTSMGKAIGGGFPVGAIAGRGEVLDVMNPRLDALRFPHSGTFSANPITMTAGFTAMRLYDRAAIERINALGERARNGIEEAVERTGAVASVTGGGSIFRVHMKPEVPVNYREAFMTKEEGARLKVLIDHLFDDGFIMINTCSATLSTAMGEAEIDALVDSIERGFAKIA